MPDSAAATVRDARHRAGLTQTELASRAGVAQSVISSYESRRREPSVDTLRRLVESAGFDLTLQLTPSRHTASLRDTVRRNRAQLVSDLKSLGASSVWLFGSVARGEDGPDSDIDLLVDIDETVGLLALGRMRSEAERLLGHAVDIVPLGGLKPDLKAHVLADSVRL